jgi:hypothetical protein
MSLHLGCLNWTAPGSEVIGKGAAHGSQGLFFNKLIRSVFLLRSACFLCMILIYAFAHSLAQARDCLGEPQSLFVQ